MTQEIPVTAPKLLHSASLLQESWGSTADWAADAAISNTNNTVSQETSMMTLENNAFSRTMSTPIIIPVSKSPSTLTNTE